MHEATNAISLSAVTSSILRMRLVDRGRAGLAHSMTRRSCEAVFDTPHIIFFRVVGWLSGPPSSDVYLVNLTQRWLTKDLVLTCRHCPVPSTQGRAGHHRLALPGRRQGRSRWLRLKYSRKKCYQAGRSLLPLTRKNKLEFYVLICFANMTQICGGA